MIILSPGRLRAESQVTTLLLVIKKTSFLKKI